MTPPFFRVSSFDVRIVLGIEIMSCFFKKRGKGNLGAAEIAEIIWIFKLNYFLILLERKLLYAVLKNNEIFLI